MVNLVRPPVAGGCFAGRRLDVDGVAATNGRRSAADAQRDERQLSHLESLVASVGREVAGVYGVDRVVGADR